jgi:hypothetical protein
MRNQSYHRIWRFLVWGILSAALLTLLLLPLTGTGVSLVDHGGIASAQTIPPEEGFGLGGLCSCFRPALGTTVVTTSIIADPPHMDIPPVDDDGLLALIEGFEPLPPSEVPVIVPDGIITNPVGVIDFEILRTVTSAISSSVPIDLPAFDATTTVLQELDHGTLVVESEPERDMVARLQPLQTDEAWPFINAILSRQHDSIQGLPPDSTVRSVLHLFTLDVYYADTGEEINTHDLDLLLALCLRDEFFPDTVALLRLDNPTLPPDPDPEQLEFEIPQQRYAAAGRTLASYLPETSVFAIVTVGGRPVPQIDPLLLTGRAVEDAPPFCIPDDRISCQCNTLPLGVADVDARLVRQIPAPPNPPQQIKALIPPAPVDIPSFIRLPVPSGFIDQKISVINTDFGTSCEDGSLIVPASPTETIQVDYEEIRLTEQERQDLLDELNQPGSIPDLLPSQEIGRIISVFELDLSKTSEEGIQMPFTEHIPELIMRTCFETEFSPETPLVLRLDQDTEQYLRPVQEYSHPVRVLVAYPAETGTRFIVATVAERGPGSVEAIDPTVTEELAASGDGTAAEPLFASILREYIPNTIIPAGLPGSSIADETGELAQSATTPQTSRFDGTTVLLWSLVGAVGVSLVAIVLWRRQAKRS